jgi:ribosomal protein S27E
MLKCPKCGSEKLIYYNEKVIVYETPINKNGTIPKRKKISSSQEQMNAPEHVECKQCDRYFWFETDGNNKITELYEIDSVGRMVD